MDLQTTVKQIISSRIGVVHGYMPSNRNNFARIYVVWDDDGQAGWYYVTDFRIIG